MGLYPEKEQPQPLKGKKLLADRTLLVIPLYNHGKTIREVVLRAQTTGLPVLVVDDGSDDGGSAGLEALGCRVHRLERNRGKGAALLAAAVLARDEGYQAILTVDADGQHDPTEATLLLAEAMQATWPVVVIGARRMIQDTVPKSSHFGRNFSNFWVRLECGAELSDTQSGFRLYPVESLLALKFSTSRYDFEIESLVRLVWSGIEVREVDVSVHYPPAEERISHFHAFRDNARLTLLHSRLICRRLLPFGNRRLSSGQQKEPVLVVKNPLKTLKNLCREHSSPVMLGTAVWMGLFLGALPLIACHTLVIIYVTHRLHLNKVAAVAASQFCMPPVVPVLCIEVGSFLRSGSFIFDLSWEHWLLEIHHRLFDWFVGSLVGGPLLGFVGGGIIWWWARKMGGDGRVAMEVDP